MGRAGNRTGYKVFSFNTTIRNPGRNYYFLRVFEDFDGQVMDDKNLRKYLIELVRKGYYRMNIISSTIRYKFENDIELDDTEINKVIEDNPQECGTSGRVMTQLRSLKDQGFLLFETIRRGVNKISITAIGRELLNNQKDQSIVYTKAFLGLHAKNPCRTTMLNESRPFLNTLFVINEVNKYCKEHGLPEKGILKHEFVAFVLSMKDCNYKAAANEIIKYRQLFRSNINQKYIEEYLQTNDILELQFSSLIKDYTDEVFRKFEMTSLLIMHGAYNYVYINFSQYNIEKINSILQFYSDYSYKNFSTAEEYNSYINDIVIPWEMDVKIKRRVVEAKAAALRMSLDNSITLEQQEEYLDRIFYNQALSKVINDIDLTLIYKELLILSGKNNEKSKFEHIGEPLRLEYLLTLLIGKKYGLSGLVSNIIYNEDGVPLHCAPSGKCDIMYFNENGSYILEPTMQRGRNQQLNSETTNIARHVKNEKNNHNLDYRVMMVAPYVHPDVADYFMYKLKTENVKLTTLTIAKTIDLILESNDILNLNINYDEIIDFMKITDSTSFANSINDFEFDITKI